VHSIHYQDWRHLCEHRHREQAHLDPGSHLECQLRRSMPVYRSIRGLDSMHFATGRQLGEPRPNNTTTVQRRPNANLDRHGSQSSTQGDIRWHDQWQRRLDLQVRRGDAPRLPHLRQRNRFWEQCGVRRCCQRIRRVDAEPHDLEPVVVEELVRFGWQVDVLRPSSASQCYEHYALLRFERNSRLRPIVRAVLVCLVD
jgi:hypothetical protein